MRWRMPFVTDDGQLLTSRLRTRAAMSIASPTTIRPHVDTPGHARSRSARTTSARGLPYARSTGAGRSFPAAAPQAPPSSSSRSCSWSRRPMAATRPASPTRTSPISNSTKPTSSASTACPAFDFWEAGPRANFGMRTEAYFPTGSVELLLGEVLPAEARSRCFTTARACRRQEIRRRRAADHQIPALSEPHPPRRHRPVDGSIRRNEVYLDGDYGRTALDSTICG